MDELLKAIFISAAQGKVNIDGEIFHIGFTTDIFGPRGQEFTTGNSDIFPKLYINNYQLFKDKLIECIELQKSRVTHPYREEKNNIKYLTIMTFINATTYDFSNPLSFLDRYISFLQDNTFENLNETVNIPDSPLFFKKVQIKNKKQDISMETPNKLTFSLTDVIDGSKYSYTLPEISYGICIENGEPVCYIYNILNKERKEVKDHSKLKYRKRVAKSLYKANEGVVADESLNLLDVSPSTVISLSLFLGLLERKNIKQIRVVEYIPERYISRYLSTEENPLQKEKWQKRNNTIITNATDKFIATFFRMMYHLDNLDWQFERVFGDEIIRLYLKETKKIKPDMINYLYQQIKNNIVDLQQRL